VKLTDEFLSRYLKEYDFYTEAARICASQAETILESNGIRAIVTFRAKRYDRLDDKIEKRAKTKNYQTIEDIYADIIDLAGVRIALYFPGDREDVEKLINERFKVKKTKRFPDNSKRKYDKVFNGYKATHYRVFLREAKLSASNQRFATALIEIQVASVLMHAWAEVEHDLVYKPLSGSLSEDEYAILDELNGLVLTGEISLERLQKAFKTRIEKEDKQFNNHFELSAFIYDVLKIDYPHLKTEPFMGRVDLLMKLLKQAKLDKPDKVKKYISKVVPQEEKRPIGEQLIDIILSEKPKLYATFEKIKKEDSIRHPYKFTDEILPEKEIQALIGQFLSEWIKIEKITRKAVNEKLQAGDHHRVIMPYRELEKLKLLTKNEFQEYDYLRRFRNNLVHGIEIPDRASFLDAISRLKNIYKKLEQKI
jgi:ppGpp synthetase/RelA/SpoT-type nucleotidyltranferase